MRRCGYRAYLYCQADNGASARAVPWSRADGRSPVVYRSNMASSRQFVVNTAQYFRPKPPFLKIKEEICRGLKANNADYFNTAQPGAIPFMPPEAMQEQSRYNKKLDIFSLGVLMLEVATQQPPRVRLVGIGRDKEIVRRREDLSKLEEDHPLKPLILSCLEDDPKQRPDIVTVHTQLPSIMEGVEVSVLVCMTPLMHVSVCVYMCVCL